MIKQQQITTLLTVAVVAGAGLVINQAAANADQPKFSCGQSGGVPATVALTQRGMVPVIRWSSGYFDEAGFTSAVRCQMVSERFETFYKNGTLDFLTTGKMNGQKVVCVTAKQGGGCLSDGLLFTLKNESNPGQTLKDLMNVRSGAAGPLNESSSPRVYIDMEKFLNEAPVEKMADKPQANNINPQPQQPPAVGLW